MDQSIEIKKPGRPTIYSKEVWDKARDLVENNPEKSLAEIAGEIQIPVSTLESKARRDGWLNHRDLTKVRVAALTLNRITREIAFQVNDMYQHTAAALEALQYSHRIRVWKDEEGNIHYTNFDDWPDRPYNWDTLSEEDRESHRRYISPVRLKNFMEEINNIITNKKNILDFITKVTKAALPKVDPDIINITRRESEEEKVHDTKIFRVETATTLDGIAEQLDNTNEGDK
jgi:hypothetical protein